MFDLITKFLLHFHTTEGAITIFLKQQVIRTVAHVTGVSGQCHGWMVADWFTGNRLV